MKPALSIFFLLFSLNLIAQQTDTVDFLKIEAEVNPIPSEEELTGAFSSTFQILRDTKSVYLDAIAMNITDFSSEENIYIATEEKKIIFTGNFKKGKIYTVSFKYKVQPKQTLYFTGDQIWTQGQGKYTSHWLPSIDDMNDKIEFDLTVIAPSEKTVIANGKLISSEEKNGLKYSKFDMQQPMSSYLVAMAIGDFDNQTITSASGIPIQLYYKPEDKNKVEPTYRYTKQIFDFFETEIDVPYPWQNYKEVPVRDFLYAGMENTTATLFSEAFVVDSVGFNDRNYVNVNAHELAHQWFGDMVTETSGKHHWLQEGFATYYAMLAERDIFGDDFYYWKLYQSAEQLKALSDEGKGEALLNDKATSLTFYEKGAWALHILRETVGDEVFKASVKNYLNKYKFKNVSTEDFMAEVNAVSDVDLTKFEADWLKQSAFQSEEAYQSLLKSEFIRDYFEISALRKIPLSEKRILLKTALTFPNDFTGQEAIAQLEGDPISETLQLYKQGFESNNVFVRQAIALSLQAIPKKLQTEYESLLKDNSYVTVEAALYQLWSQFPENRKKYLDQSQNIIGFQNKNIRQLWLALAIVDSNYKPELTEAYLSELKSYSAESFSFEVRQISFNYIQELKLWDEATLHNLVNASVHHNWRFRDYSRKLLDEVLKVSNFKMILKNTSEEFSEKERAYLKRIDL